MQKTLRGLRRLPHDVPDGSEDGYAICASCGTQVYVGRPPALIAQEMAEKEYRARYRFV